MKDYLNLLTYLVSDTAVPVTDLLQILEDFDLSSTGDAICSPALGLYDLKRNIPNIANFNMRHREGRNMTQEEADHETARVIHGVMRVAQKIRGNFVPPAASVEHESIPPSAL